MCSTGAVTLCLCTHNSLASIGTLQMRVDVDENVKRTYLSTHTIMTGTTDVTI